MTESSSRNWLLARPAVDEDQARDIAARAFAISGEPREVGSQQDRNFVIRDGHRGILLKFDNASTSDAERDLQTLVSERLRAANVPTPRILDPADCLLPRIGVPGQHDAPETITARAFEWIDGAPLSDDAELSGTVAEQLGRLAGRSVSGLSGLTHPASERAIQWELGRAAEVVEQLLGSLPEERRDPCRDAARRAETAVRRVAAQLPRQVIHGDLTSDNVLRDATGELWVVDLGDAAMSWRVAELAIAAADVLGRTEDLSMVARVVRGYAQETPLTDPELVALWPLIVLRGAVLAVSGWSQLEIDPGNAYARARIEHEWQVFEAGLGIDPATAQAHLRIAAGLPHREGLEYAPILEGAIAELDLGVESPLLDRGAWLEPDIETRLVRALLDTEPSDRPRVAAIAPFGQARLSRTSGDVSAPGASRARCVELWAAAGTELHAPFAGTLRHDGDAIELSDRGVILRFAGAAPSVAAAEVRTGEVFATTGDTSVRITRRVAGSRPDANFVHFDGEYESSGALDPSLLLGVIAVPDPEIALRDERVRREAAMGGASERYYAEPPRIERGWGALLIETRGRAYLDMVNNVTAIGHSHPRLADDVARQLNLLNTNSRFLYGLYADFTNRLLEHSPDPALDVVIPVSSGSEANDLAIHLAQVATGRTTIVAAREGYHGWTMASDAVSTSAFDNPNALGTRPDWVDIVSAPNPYRGRYRGAEAASGYVSELREHLVALQASGRAAAAFICEPVLGNAGGVVPPSGYLAGAYAEIRAAGGLAIADEVQVGYGRLGRAFWGSQLDGAIPDIITVAKAAGNAFPLGAVITKRSILDALREDGMFFSSAGGAPASMAAGLAVLDVIRDEGLQRNALMVGEHLIERLSVLSKRHELIGAVHGAGLYLGIELVLDRTDLTPAVRETREVCERLLGHGIIMQATSERQNVLKVKPPMTLTIEQADAFVAALDTVLNDIQIANVAI